MIPLSALVKVRENVSPRELNHFGQRRSGGGFHPGNDMLAPTGTPELAVVSGEVTYGDGGGGGMGAYIAGDDGNRYVYYHLSQYVGAPRHVAPGEVIGKVGSTGNSTGPHLHFEIHPGGGGPIDPFPTLADLPSSGLISSSCESLGERPQLM